jgi:hypothetical protein
MSNENEGEKEGVLYAKVIITLSFPNADRLMDFILSTHQMSRMLGLEQVRMSEPVEYTDNKGFMKADVLITGKQKAVMAMVDMISGVAENSEFAKGDVEKRRKEADEEFKQKYGGEG